MVGGRSFFFGKLKDAIFGIGETKKLVLLFMANIINTLVSWPSQFDKK